ncbi:MAG: hypothetical protein ACMUJM_10310 [bacterium]
MDIQQSNELIKCPKCGFEHSAGDSECVRCGIIFKKFKSCLAYNHPLQHNRHHESQEELFLQNIDQKGLLSLCVGGVAATLIFIFPFWVTVFHTFPILVHEFGHTVFGWLFGYPTIPAFDFIYGGGVAVHFDRKPVLLIVIYLLCAFLLYTFRKNTVSFLLIIGCILVYTGMAFTRIHEVLILFMGHGMELIFAVIFLYRAISGSSIIVSAERPLYAFVGFFTQFCNIDFAYKLLTNKEFRFLYIQGKGGMLANDFVRIAYNYLNINLNSIVYFFLLLSFLPPIIAFLAHRYLAYWGTMLSRLLHTELEDR